MAGGKPMMTLYHYTSEEGKAQILKDGVIKQSEEGTMFGPGTYATKMPPTQGKEQVARNNYDGSMAWEQREHAGSVDYAFKVKVPAENVTRLTKEPDAYGRSIYKVNGDVDLTKTEHEVVKVDDKPQN